MYMYIYILQDFNHPLIFLNYSNFLYRMNNFQIEYFYIDKSK